VLTLISMARLWDESFWKPAPHPEKAPLNAVILIPIAGLGAATLAFTFAAEPIFNVVQRASAELLRPEVYMRAVLQGGPRP
jgi:multicomponent Na+:H+ antiporter subunit D